MNAALLIFGAAFLAGAVNAISGGGTLITFPVLVWTGMDAVIANATNTVALWPGTIAALIARRHELRATARSGLLLGFPCVTGGLVGAVILIHTPPHIFRMVVPGLMVFASLVLGAQDCFTKMPSAFRSRARNHLRRNGS